MSACRSDAVAGVLKGGCHCGKVRVELATSLHPADLHPRACDCSFCTKHGAAYVSDPHGKLRVIGGETLGEYRQGSGTAKMLLCRGCGVLVAAILEEDGRRYGTVNAQCIEGVAFGAAQTVSPQALVVDDKKARWTRLWTPDVELVRS
jgi:hypothetical protein